MGTDLISNRSLTQILASRISPSAAAPWTARPAMSIPILTDVAQILELKKNRAIAANTIGFRPQMSDNLAQIGSVATLARR
jgi:hypothetical protein